MSELLVRKCRLFTILAAAAVVATVTSAFAADAKPEWHVGLASACITPDRPIRMSGYASRTEPSDGVLSDLFAKVMAVEDAEGNRALWITADIIGFRAAVAKAVSHEITAKTGLARKKILLCPSHTHAGPQVEFKEDVADDMPADEAQTVDRNTHLLIARLGELAAAAIGDLKPARLSWGIGTATFVMNRREFTERGVRLGVNPSGYVDRSVPVLRVDSPDGKLRAVVFGCACHNTTMGGKNLKISGEYAGFAQETIEEQNPGVQAMFVIGCAGDSNPDPRGTADLARQHGQGLGAEVCRVLGEELTPVHGPLSVEFEWVELPLQPVPSREKLEEMAKGPSWLKYNAVKMLEALDKGQSLPTAYRAPFALWQFGDDLTLVGMPCETLGGYVPLLQDALGHRKLWVAGYTNDVCGYLPTAKVLTQGGYETRGLYTDIGFFAPEAQDVAVKAVSGMARQAGRGDVE